ncbi:DUF6244 family protein [Micromonospora humida]|uniref:DUF6244 family protein n=1 Tax=Micromonospora humida TaxID=2809018 RepID=UPI00344144B9
MSLTDTIGADVQAMAAGVDWAQQETAAVDQAIEQISARSVASGFAGIAVGLARARETLAQARSRPAQVDGVLGEASRSLRVVPQQSSPQETIAALTPVLAALTALDGHVSAAGSAVDDTRRLLAAALQGGQPAPSEFRHRCQGRQRAKRTHYQRRNKALQLRWSTKSGRWRAPRRSTGRRRPP